MPKRASKRRGGSAAPDSLMDRAYGFGIMNKLSEGGVVPRPAEAHLLPAFNAILDMLRSSGYVVTETSLLVDGQGVPAVEAQPPAEYVARRAAAFARAEEETARDRAARPPIDVDGWRRDVAAAMESGRLQRRWTFDHFFGNPSFWTELYFSWVAPATPELTWLRRYSVVPSDKGDGWSTWSCHLVDGEWRGSAYFDRGPITDVVDQLARTERLIKREVRIEVPPPSGP